MAPSFQGDEKRNNVLDLLGIEDRPFLPSPTYAGKALGAVVRGHDALGVELAAINNAHPKLRRAPAAARTGYGRRDSALKSDRNPQRIRHLVAQHAKPYLAVGNDGLASCGIACQARQRRSDTVWRGKRARCFRHGQAAQEQTARDDAQPPGSDTCVCHR